MEYTRISNLKEKIQFRGSKEEMTEKVNVMNRPTSGNQSATILEYLRPGTPTAFTLSV